MIQFVQNYEDLSTDKGYQFKFHCDKCGNGFMTEFQTSAIGMAESALKVAGSIFGGFLNSAGNSAYEIQRAIGGPAHDSALGKAVEEGKKHFHQCGRCGKWVCPDVCWNADAQHVRRVRPEVPAGARELAGSRQGRGGATAAPREGPEDGLRRGHRHERPGVVRAPSAVAGAANKCTACGVALGDGRFCPNCGAEKHVMGCSGCGAVLPAGTHFCAQCGTKVG